MSEKEGTLLGSWRSIPEIRHLDAERRKAAWQVGYGAVSARPVFWLALGAMAVAVAVGSIIGESVAPGWSGRIVGVTVGALAGGVLNDAIMRRAMRPHILKYLAEDSSHD